MSEHYTEDRKYSYIHNAWILESSWNDKEEIAKLNHEIAISKRDYDVIYKLYKGLEEENVALKVQMNELIESIPEIARKAYLCGIADKEEGNDYWCEQGSKERINDLIEDGLDDGLLSKKKEQSIAAHDNEVIEKCEQLHKELLVYSNEEDCDADVYYDKAIIDYRDAIRSLKTEEQCQHDWKYQGHGHNYEVWQCQKCGAEEEK